MKFYVKAALLSALILPGLGQLYKGSKAKGGIIIAMVNLFLAMGLFVVMKGMGDLFVTAHLSGMAAAEQVMERVKGGLGPALQMGLLCFGVLWVYSTFDALIGKVVLEEESEGEAGNKV